MSFNLDKLNMTCAPMYNAQNTNQVLGYMCNLKKNGKEGFQNSPALSSLIKCNSDPGAAKYPNYDLPKSFPLPSYGNKSSDGNKIQLNQILKYDPTGKTVINSFVPDSLSKNPSNCNANYWIKLFNQSTLYSAQTGNPDPNVMSLKLTVVDSLNQDNLIEPISATTTQGISNYNNIMAWFAKYPTLKPGFMINFTQTSNLKPVYQNFYATIPDANDQNYGNVSSILTTFSSTYKNGTQVEAGKKRVTNSDDTNIANNCILLYLGQNGTRFWNQYVDDNLNYFDNSNIQFFGQENKGIDFQKVAIEVRVCAILPNGSLYNWTGPVINTP